MEYMLWYIVIGLTVVWWHSPFIWEFVNEDAKPSDKLTPQGYFHVICLAVIFLWPILIGLELHERWRKE